MVILCWCAIHTTDFASIFHLKIWWGMIPGYSPSIYSRSISEPIPVSLLYRLSFSARLCKRIHHLTLKNDARNANVDLGSICLVPHWDRVDIELDAYVYLWRIVELLHLERKSVMETYFILDTSTSISEIWARSFIHSVAACGPRFSCIKAFSFWLIGLNKNE